MKLSSLFAKKTILSFEVFPPKPTADERTIYDTLDGLKELHPDFISVTYGARGGNNCAKTLEIASAVKNQYGIESVAHLPCINLSQKDAADILARMKENGVENILALRGDRSDDIKPCGEFVYASDLVKFIRQNGDFHIMGACYPEGHPESGSLAEDIEHLKEKVEAGVEHLITQLFFDNDCFYRFREQTERAGISVPIEVGIMPVTNKKSIESMVSLCGTYLPKPFMDMMGRYGDSPEDLKKAGIQYAIRQIEDLLAHDVSGVHLYTMNKPYVAKEICSAIEPLM